MAKNITTSAPNAEVTSQLTFSFQPKFEKLLTDENRPLVETAFQKICEMNSHDVVDMLWKMTYNSETTTTVLNDLGLADVFPAEELTKLRKEMRLQYEKLNPNFLAVTVPAEYQEAFNALANKVNDAVVSKLLFDHCRTQLLYQDTQGMERLLFLLSSENESHFFGGLRSLRFGREEAEFLKPYHLQIHDFLKVMYEAKKQKESSTKNLPFADLAQRLEDAGIEVRETVAEPVQPLKKSVTKPLKKDPPKALAKVSEPVSNEILPKTLDTLVKQTNFIALTPENILAHNEHFKNFVSGSDTLAGASLIELGLLGFDLNKIFSKKAIINDFLNAADALSE